MSSATIRRTIRSALQAAVATITQEGLFRLIEGDWNVARLALAAFLYTLVVLLHNGVEDAVPSIDTREVGSA